jgi:hypothetical protein
VLRGNRSKEPSPRTVPKAKSAVVATLGVDVGKNTFHLVGLDKRCTIVLRKGLSRAQSDIRLPTRPAAWSAWRPGSEPLTWAAALRSLATAKYVRPFCRKQNAAQAIAKAATGPTVRYVTRKTPAQLDLQGLCGVRGAACRPNRTRKLEGMTGPSLMFSRRGLREERSKAWSNGLHGAFKADTQE